MNPDMRISMPRTQSQQCQEVLAGTPPAHLEPRVSGCSSGEHVLGDGVCISASDSLYHALGNHGSTWGLCQHNDKNELFLEKALLLIVL